jgi:methionine biosynthesis protein MetW
MSAYAPPSGTANGVPPVTASQRPDANGLRPDLALIAGWIAPGAHVLDLGCGDGALLDHLQRAKRCTGYGAEIDDAQVLACARRGVDVIQQDIEAGLDIFSGFRFDVVVLSMAIQATHQTERVLREMSRLGAEGIVSFPNFGHWSHAWSILRGRMPISREMPYRWYDTPNLHLSTPKDFEDFLEGLGLAITRRVFLADGRPVAMLAGLRCTQAIYGFRVR